MVLVWHRRQVIQQAEARLLTQAIATPSETEYIQEALDDFANALYPWRRAVEAERKKQLHTVLEQWANIGPIPIQPLVPTTAEVHKRKLLQRGDAARKKRSEELRTGQLVKLSSKAWRQRSGARQMATQRVRRRE